MTEGRILVVDDEKNVRASLARMLKVDGYETIEAASGEEAVEVLAGGGKTCDLVMLDVMMPGMGGMETLKAIRRQEGAIPVIMMSGHGTIETAVEATKLGAHDFIEKPLSDEKILLTIQNTLRYKRLADENLSLKEQMERRYALVGESAAMRRIRERIRQVAPTTGRVLILGESGTGKELVARAIHKMSRRAAGPFVKFNCAAVPAELAESELFGHEKGAFTGAIRMRVGRFETAHRGTLLLDEIGDLRLDLQAKVLRVLQDGELERVGGNETVRVDVRIICATNRNLVAEMEAGRFREDLYFRVNVIPFVVPPLRERREDIPALVDHFLKLGAEEDEARTPKVIEPDAIESLKEYDWPGNVRELRNVVERLSILLPGEKVSRDDVRMMLPEGARAGAGLEGAGGEASASAMAVGSAADAAGDDLEAGTGSLRDRVAGYEREVILATLRANAWNISKSAADLRIERSHLYKKMKILGIAREG